MLEGISYPERGIMKVLRTFRVRQPFVVRVFSHHCLPVFSHSTIRHIMQDLQTFVYGGGGAYFTPCMKPPPKWKIALGIWTHNVLRKHYRSLEPVARTRYWNCPVCPEKEMGTWYWSRFPGGVSWCKNFHYWNNKTGKYLVPPYGLTYQVVALAHLYMKRFGAFDWKSRKDLESE